MRKMKDQKKSYIIKAYNSKLFPLYSLFLEFKLHFFYLMQAKNKIRIKVRMKLTPIKSPFNQISNRPPKLSIKVIPELVGREDQRLNGA